MTAVRARLDQEAPRPSQRTTPRRKLQLRAAGPTVSDSDVLILDISTTGLLIKTGERLSVGESVEFDLPAAPGVAALVKWSSGQLFGCQFKVPVSVATVSAALLRAPSAPRRSEVPALSGAADSASEVDDNPEKLPLPVRLRWIAGLMLVSWVSVAAPVYLAWPYLAGSVAAG